MLKKEVTYEDFDGNQVTETLYFHISKSQVVEMQHGGVAEMLKRVTVPGATIEDIFESFKKLLGMGYGERIDGKTFRKDPEKTKDFLDSPAYDALFMSLVQGGTQNMLEFIGGMLPGDLVNDEVLAQAAQQAGLKYELAIPETSPQMATGIVLPEPGAVKSPQSDVPAAFQGSSAAARARARLRAGNPQRPESEEAINESDVPAEKSVDEMSADELRAMVRKLSGAN